MNNFHLAQINIAQAQDEMDTVIMKGFVNRLEEINALADDADGFIWRLQSEQGDSTAIRVFDDPLLLVNMSVWEDIASLKNFVYRTAHVELIQDREAWFNKIAQKHQALWWVPAGHIPTVEEGKERLDYLREHGPSAHAFIFAKPFEAQS